MRYCRNLFLIYIILDKTVMSKVRLPLAKRNPWLLRKGAFLIFAFINFILHIDQSDI